MKRNSFIYIFKLSQMPRDNMDDGGIHAGALFFVVVMIMFNGMAEIALTIFKLPAYFKHRDLLFFPSWAYALPTWILKIPETFVEVGLRTFLTYYVMGFDPNVSRLFKQFLLLILVHQWHQHCSDSLEQLGEQWELLAHLEHLLFFYNLHWVVLSLQGIAQGGVEPLGAAVVRAQGFFPDAYWYWIGIGALVGFTMIFNLFYSIAIAYLNPFGKPQAMISEDSDNADSTDGADSVSEGENKKRGMVLPFEPHSITFDDVVYSVDMPPEMKEQGSTEDRLVLLKGVSGAFTPGVLVEHNRLLTT